MSTRPLRRASGYFGVRLPLFRSRDAVHGLASHLRIIIPEPSPQPAGTSEDLSQGQSSRGPSHQESSSKLPRRPALVPLISRPPISRRVAAVRLSLSASKSPARGSEMNCPAPSGLLETGRHDEEAQPQPVQLRATAKGYHPKSIEQPNLEHLHCERRHPLEKFWRKSSSGDAGDALCGH